MLQLKSAFLMIFLVIVSAGCFNVIANQDRFVLTGEVNLIEGKVSFEDKWRQAANNTQPDMKEKTEIEVSISNCAGHLVAAKMIYLGKSVWQSQIVADSIAPDADEKIKKCKYAPTSTYNYGMAFAVVKSLKDIKNYKSDSLDLQKTFSTLPADIQSWANCEKSLVPEDCVRKEKNTLSLMAGDNWADTDGDGEVDLIIVKGNCNNTGDYTCGKTFKWNGWRWLEIASSKPA